jgi:hypothetical protein
MQRMYLRYINVGKNFLVHLLEIRLVTILLFVLKCLRVYFESQVNDRLEIVNVLLELTFLCEQIANNLAFNYFYPALGFNLTQGILT